jgi:hypothetical protein
MVDAEHPYQLLMSHVCPQSNQNGLVGLCSMEDFPWVLQSGLVKLDLQAVKLIFRWETRFTAFKNSFTGGCKIDGKTSNVGLSSASFLLLWEWCSP